MRSELRKGLTADPITNNCFIHLPGGQLDQSAQSGGADDGSCPGVRADTRGPLPQLKVQQPWETRSMLLTLAVSRYRSTRDLVFAA
jgi:hypothetical protein